MWIVKCCVKSEQDDCWDREKNKNNGRNSHAMTGGKGHEKKSEWSYTKRLAQAPEKTLFKQRIKLARNPIIHKPMYTVLNVLQNIIISATNTNINIKGRQTRKSISHSKNVKLLTRFPKIFPHCLSNLN
jgi:hypothetical protein